ncbi:hypothetical protein [Halopiger djelfimassiliensis]|uniref:hypothetical protein n=1 Tax=Halopiger djelfimassiliensis TaxID=1293047 RepID=UPI000677BEA6|nr:hypothetical protein [Halopiger djelfimassiliensis]
MNSLLWALAVLWYGVGDLVSTHAGLEYDGLEEGQPLVRAILGDPPSTWRFGLFKAGLLGVCYVGYAALEGYRIRFLVPAGLAAVGVAAVSNNVRAILEAR